MQLHSIRQTNAPRNGTLCARESRVREEDPIGAIADSSTKKAKAKCGNVLSVHRPSGSRQLYRPRLASSKVRECRTQQPRDIGDTAAFCRKSWHGEPRPAKFSAH